MAELIRYEYFSGANGALVLVKLDNGSYALNWDGYVDDGVFYPSNYPCTVCATLAAAQVWFEEAARRNRC